jgi:ferredoxin
VKREIIFIDEEKCNGCGNCIPGCPEGALQLIDGKARLVADYFCDGLGACIGECPLGAIKTEVREAEPYNERKVFQNIIKQGPNTIKAHLKHLYEHGETEYLKVAIDECGKQNIEIPEYKKSILNSNQITGLQHTEPDIKADVPAELKNWPVQLKLISPNAPYLEGSHLLFAADCTSFAYPNMHRDFIKGRVAIILCPKLDPYTDAYLEKLTEIFQTKTISTVSVVRMQVPCCSGLTRIVEDAIERAGLNIQVKEEIISIGGEIISKK